MGGEIWGHVTAELEIVVSRTISFSRSSTVWYCSMNMANGGIDAKIETFETMITCEWEMRGVNQRRAPGVRGSTGCRWSPRWSSPSSRS